MKEKQAMKPEDMQKAIKQVREFAMAVDEEGLDRDGLHFALHIVLDELERLQSEIDRLKNPADEMIRAGLRACEETINNEGTGNDSSPRKLVIAIYKAMTQPPKASGE